ncbi:MAG: F0F1 ATP synthase subunit A [Candidatus Obscuribacterales bacterium]|jgi:F-type H+-transporting ATPase subunit a|nr:F0F1 ATP synthase subunit A [Candidatus Obscuribacterales bacterium]
MLGKNLPLSYFVHDPAVTNSYFLGIPQLGTVGDIHIDTLILSWSCMGLILAGAAVIVPTMTSKGPGHAGQAVIEGIYTFILDLCKGQMGHHYKPFFPLIAAVFLFVLFGNFIGIGPWLYFEKQAGWPHVNGEHFEVCSPTTDFNVTFGLALIALLVYLGSGFWAHGPKYLKLYLNPIEWLDMIIRPATLALRLMMVITADELMRGAAILMVPVLLPTGVMAFEMFIGILQAFVFALLTSIYIGLTVSHH